MTTLLLRQDAADSTRATEVLCTPLHGPCSVHDTILLLLAQTGSLSYRGLTKNGVNVLLACISPTTSSARTTYQRQLHPNLHVGR